MIGDDHTSPYRMATLAVSDMVDLIATARAAGRHADAEVVCRVAIDREPENASLYLLLGWIALDQAHYAEAMASARQAEQYREHDVTGVARLLVFAAASSGNWKLADDALLRLSASDETAARAIAEETAPVFLACVNARRKTCAFESAVNSFEQAPAMLSVVAPDIMREIRATASACYLALGEGETAIELFGHAAQALAPPAPPASPPCIDRSRPLLVTSLMPARLEVQRAAVRSWERLGFDVASLNARDEIDQLHDEFETVTFHVATRDASERFGRPLVYLDDMLAILAQARDRRVGVINSDIVFSSDADVVVNRALRLANHAFLFGHRSDVDCLAEDRRTALEIYQFGYDWFLFRAEQAGELAGGEMVFGAPWWDIWLPLRARLLAFDIVNVRQPVALHENHPTRWSRAELERMGSALAGCIVAAARQTPPVSRFQHRMNQLAAVLARFEPDALNAGGALDWFASLLRGLVQQEATPFEVGRASGPTPFWDSMGRI